MTKEKNVHTPDRLKKKNKKTMLIQASPSKVVCQIEEMNKEMNKHSHEIVERKQVMLKLLKHKVQLRTQIAERRERQ